MMRTTAINNFSRFSKRATLFLLKI